ncbi:MAG: GTP-binding protein [Oscillospiraceae bacterium]|nr:GTP-binding protein [Oscillospiraceae bacterium]
MTTVDVFSGFLGAGKTTLIKKLIKESFAGKKVVLIENEFGEIGIDGSFLKESGIQINELNDGCICCSLVGDFRSALKKVVEQYNPDVILIEPSGVGKLSDVTRAVEGVAEDLPITLRSFVTVADAKKVRMYMKNFGEFYDDQVSHASCILLSRTKGMDEAKLSAAVALLREKNPNAVIVTTDWDELTGDQILAAMTGKNSLVEELRDLARKANELHHDDDDDDEDEHEHHHHHHDHDDDDDDEDEHEHHHHHHDDHDDDDDEHEHEHHHHHHDEDDEDEHEHHHHHHEDDDEEEEHENHHHHHDDEDEDEQHHHHEHGEGCSCGCHDHHDGHHHADEVFDSWGNEGPKQYTKEKLEEILEVLSETDDYGMVLRSKGIVPTADGKWLHFDLTPGEYEIREGAADVTGRLCVIGSKLKEDELKKLFELA